MSEPAYIPLYTAAQVRELDRIAIQERNIAGYQLMSRAGQALADCVARRWPRLRRVCIVCGAGNNGGDGYVLGRLLRDAGVEVTLLGLADPDTLSGDAARAAGDYRAAGGVVAPYGGELPHDAELLVDALLGTGLDRPVEGRYRDVIEALNRHPAPLLAVDVPSGLHADTGAILGVAVQAACTVTFIGRKRGLYTGAGGQQAGSVEFADLAVPPDIYSTQRAGVELIAQLPLEQLLAPRRRDAHKGDFGHVLVVGGNAGMSGAARLAAEAAARCGAGLVSVATRAAHAPVLNAGCPELMVHAVERAAELAPLLVRASVVVVGPGLGRSAWSQQLLGRVLDSDLPLVMDADALNLLAQDPLRRDNWILTPHPGEAARLLGQCSAEIQRDRFAALERLVADYAGSVVLKGAGSLVGDATSGVRLCAHGNPGMASGGMGDVLSGVLGALLAQGVPRFEAATTGVWLHAVAADRAARQGERGLLARDLIPWLRTLVNPGGAEKAPV
jgi:NAD(P)H-hydrate epimerase